jgi:hypothetical protein
MPGTPTRRSKYAPKLKAKKKPSKPNKRNTPADALLGRTGAKRKPKYPNA